MLKSDDCANKTCTPGAGNADDHVNRKQQVPAAEEEVDVYERSVVDWDKAVNAPTVVQCLLLGLKLVRLARHK